jgi:putative flippase GtrA
MRWWVAAGSLPAVLGLRWLAFRNPEITERFYSQGVYPPVARVMGWVNGWAPIPLAEIGLVAALVIGFVWLRRWWWAQLPTTRIRRLVRLALILWCAVAVGIGVFLAAWGFHYARPPLRDRLQLDLTGIRDPEVLALGERFVLAANAAHTATGADTVAPTSLPYGIDEIDRILDEAYRRLGLPGDAITAQTSPAKPLLSSAVFSRLGISGIFIPFTGEPLFNADTPAASRAVAVAHEKAHQRGITDEGEANLAAVLACLESNDPYLRYAALLYASSSLVGAASRYDPVGASEAASLWAAGPRADLVAIQEFWARYQGVATRAASRVNDAYLRSNRVEGGVQSYGRVAAMLVGLERQGTLDFE